MTECLIVLASAFSAAWVGLNDRLRGQIPLAQTRLVEFFEWFGDLAIFCGRLARTAFVPPYEGRELVRQLEEVGTRSLPLVALAGAATGVSFPSNCATALRASRPRLCFQPSSSFPSLKKAARSSPDWWLVVAWQPASAPN